MKHLKATTKSGLGRKSHHHIVYLNEEEGFALCSPAGGKNNKHVHEIVWQAPVPPEVEQDPETGEEIEVSPGQDGYWVVVPSEEDGHTHELVEVEVEVPFPEETEAEICAEVHSQFGFATEIEEDSLKEGDLCEEFYFGMQWAPEDVKKLAEDERACLTLNRIQPKVQQLCGYEREQRTEWRFTPVEGGDQKTADLLNLVTSVIREQCNYAREKSKVFENQAISGRGIFNIYVSRDKDLRGEIRIESFPWRDVRFGPHEKEDLSDCEFLIKHRMQSFSRLKQVWGDKVEEIKHAYDVIGPRVVGTEHTTAESNFDTQRWAMSVGGLPMADPVRKEYRVLERWQRIYVPTHVAVFDADNFTYNCLGWSESDLAKLRSILGFRTVPITVQKIRITTVCGGVVLSDEYPADLPVDDFFCIPVYGIKRGDRFQGKVALAIDAQRELNKRHSQAIDIGNRFITNGWFIDESTFPDPQSKRQFVVGSSRAGFVQTVTDADRPPRRVEGGAFPPMIVDLMNLADNRIEQLLSIDIQSQGTHDSAAKLQFLQRQKLAGSEYLFDNLAYAQKIVAQRVVALVQRYYSADRIYRMVAPKIQEQGGQLGGEPFEEFTEDDIWQMLTTVDLTQYDLMVAEQTYSASQRQVNFILLAELAAKGLQISPRSLIRLSEMPEAEKQAIIQEMDAMAQAAQEEMQMKYQTELQKTAMAKGVGLPDGGQSDQVVAEPGGLVAG